MPILCTTLLKPAFGGSFVSDDGHKAVGYMDSPETIAAVQFDWDLINKWKIVPPATMMSSFGVAGSSSQGNAFLAGNAAMDPIDGDYAIGNLKTAPFKWGAIPYPTLPGHPYYAYFYPAPYAMWRGSRHKKEAWELMTFISSPEANAIVAKTLFWTPPTHHRAGQLRRPLQFKPELPDGRLSGVLSAPAHHLLLRPVSPDRRHCLVRAKGLNAWCEIDATRRSSPRTPAGAGPTGQ